MAFVPNDFDPASRDQVVAMCQALLDRVIDSSSALEKWFADLCELFETIDEHESRTSIENACHTDDEAIEKAYLHVVQVIRPAYEPLFFELQKKLLENPHREGAALQGLAVMTRSWQADVELFRPENIALQTQLAELSKDYGKACGAMMVEFKGKTRTLQQMAAFLEETDRATRETAWRLVSDRRLQDRAAFDTIFDQQLKLRQQVAENAGHADFRDYMWVAKKRFDYTPEDCHAFGDAVAEHALPLLRRLDDKQRAALGVDTLRPWDGSVDPKGRPPLRPFAEDDIDGFVEKTRLTFERYCPTFAQQFATLRTNGNLDLGSRSGKRPGGFQASLEKSRQPFIFMNAAGMQRDVETLLHEGGHAFHYIDSSNIANLFARHAPLEFCEVASMSQELLATDHYDIFYDDPASAARAKRVQLEGAIRVLPWVATIDGFQHWLYTHPGHDVPTRTDAWMNIVTRFSTGATDWSGLEEARAAMWQRQVHLYQVPFYYIEYGIAQLGALRVWLNHRRDAQGAMAKLRAAFALGGTRPLPELFEAAGIPFDFSPAAVKELIEAVGRELDQLPD